MKTIQSHIQNATRSCAKIEQKLGYRLPKALWVVFRTVMLAGLCFVILYPVLIMLSKAFMDVADVFDSTVILIPKNFTLDNVRTAIERMDYWTALKNSLLLSGMTSVLSTVSCLLAGYGFARFDMKFKNILFALVLFTTVVPPQLTMISQFLNFQYFDFFGIIKALTGKNGINLINSWLPFVLLSVGAQGLKNGLFIYLFRQIFKGMPKETEEAALVDGAGTFRTFVSIMLPGAVNTIITVLLFSFVWQYNDTLYSNLLLKGTPVLSIRYNALQPVAVGNASYLDSVEYVAVLKSTGVLLILLPLLILYLVLQRFFIDGIERSGLVG